MINIIEFKKEIKSLFEKLKDNYDLSDGFKLQLEETVYEQNYIKFSVPEKIRFVRSEYTLDTIDLTKELSIDMESIERRLTRSLKRIDFYRWIFSFAKEYNYMISFNSESVLLFTEDRKEIEIYCHSNDRYSIYGKYILSPNAMAVRYKIDSLLYFGLCDAMPSNASVRSAISTDGDYAIGLAELEKALKDTRRHLDYASERTLKMELVEKKGD